jgi:hypothetical protein
MPTLRSSKTRLDRRPIDPVSSVRPARLPRIRAGHWWLAGGLGILLLASRDPTVLLALLLVPVGLVGIAVLFDPGGDGRAASRFTRACSPWAASSLLQSRFGTGDDDGSFGGEDGGDD